jgi:carbamate kinase
MAIPEETFAELAEYYDETYTAAADMFKVVEASITYVNSAGSAADPALREAVASYVDKNGETLPFSSYAR